MRRSASRCPRALGPALLGGVFDGLLRPLLGAGTWLPPGDRTTGLAATGAFEPIVAVGDTVAPGDTLGVVRPAGPLALRILVPRGPAAWSSGSSAGRLPG